MNKKYVCKICGWVYDPAEHDNVAFETRTREREDVEPAYC